MKKLLRALLLGLVFPVAALAVTNGDNPFTPYTSTNAISVSNVASTGIQPSTAGNCTQYKLENAGTVDVWVAFGTASTNAAQIPTAGVPKSSTLVRAGATQVVTQIPNAYVSAITASGTATLYVACGTGLGDATAAAVTVISAPAPSGTSDVNIVQTGGVTQLRGAGAVGTGSERIAVGQDTTTIAGSAPGTAGTASSNVVTVQGVASMTPVADNVTQVNGSAVTLGTGAASANTPRVAVASDSAITVNTNSLAGADAKSNTVTNIGNVFDYPSVYNGATWDRMRGDTLGTWVEGNVAIDAPATANPMLMGGRASSAIPTGISANGDAQALWLNVNGAAVTASFSQSTAQADSVSNTISSPTGSGGSLLYQPTLPMVFNGTTWDRVRGNTTGTNVQGATGGNPIGVRGGNSTLNGSADASVKSGAGDLVGIFVASSTSCTIKLWDNTAASGTILVNTFSAGAATWYPLPFHFGTGLYIDITNTCDYSISYN